MAIITNLNSTIIKPSDVFGYEVNTEDIFQEEIIKQVELAVDEATSIIFMLNVEEGLTDTDYEIYEMLRPDRSSYEELNKLADYLETTYSATENAKFIREAATVYKERGILRR